MGVNMRRWTRTATVGLALAVSCAVAGCGGSDSSKDGLAHAGGGATATASAASAASGDVVKWTQCLREHGVDVQDPPPGGAVTLPQDSPAVKDAMDKCKQYQSTTQGRTGYDANDPAHQERIRKFAKCMRDNGVDWADPVPGQQGATVPAMTPQLMEVFTKCSKEFPVTGGGK
jgi:hypothetical protein